MKQRDDVRNFCIIAHVDHGKTTLIDFLLRQSGLFASHEKTTDRMMDSNDIERERGITIQAKNASIHYKGKRLNIIDTPGHADFGGEVERIMGAVDGAVLLVDAVEGPLPQTRFVLEKALARGHSIILCINKVDRSELLDEGIARIQEVVNATFDLFVDLKATEKQCDFPIVYACARKGWCTTSFSEVDDLRTGKKQGTLQPLFDLFIDYLPPPSYDDEEKAFSMQIFNLAWSDYLGRLALGRVHSGTVKANQNLFCLGLNETTKQAKTLSFSSQKVMGYDGLKPIDIDLLKQGDIGILAGCTDVTIGDTISSSAQFTPFERIYVEPPTLKMTFTINTSPNSGQEGDAIQSRKLKERLLRECQNNVALRFEDGVTAEQFYLFGRGELQFAVLIETMRREGLEFMVGRPEVVMKKSEDGKTLEPVEVALLDVPKKFSGEITEMFQGRKGILTNYEEVGNERVRLSFEIPSRGILGIRSRFMTITRGEGLFSSQLKGYEDHRGGMLSRLSGTLISDRGGKTTDYALETLEERGVLFIRPGTEVYEGMVIGECSRENDMNVNPVKPKKLTNVRKTSSDGIVILAGIREMSLERSIEWIDDDEWIECTPKSVRIRKKILDGTKRSVVRRSRD
ncbi:MAG: translational GTPase TypA [Oligoflexales bacterium]|nr:translational GTPase TypA [Oligoflexales bacterium]